MPSMTRYLAATVAATVGAAALVLVPSWNGGDAADAAAQRYGIGAASALNRSLKAPAKTKPTAKPTKSSGVATKPAAVPAPVAVTSLSPTQLKIMNWYPANASWANLWSRYDHNTTNEDFKTIRAANANTVRIIVQPSAMGFPNVTAPKARIFQDVLDTAAANGLAIQLTLFDLWGNYDQVQKSVAWVKNLATLVPDMRLIRLIELQNEINPNSGAAMSWARTLLPALSQSFPGVPRTLSVNGTVRLAGIQALDSAVGDEMDVIDVHMYDSWGYAYSTLKGAKALAGSRPVIIGELGQPTAPGSSASEQSQAAYFAKMQVLTSSLGLPLAGPWTLNDFTPSGASIALNDNSQYAGLRRADGSPKPAFDAIKKIFGGDAGTMQRSLSANTAPTTTPDALLDGGMEGETVSNGKELFGNWRALGANLASDMGITRSQVRSGGRSAYITGAKGSSSGLASFCQSLPIPKSRSLSVQAYTKMVDAGRKSTSQIALGWFAADSRYLGQDVSASAAPNGAWQRVLASATAPAQAVFVQVCVKSYDNPGTTFFDDVSMAAG